MKLKLFTVVLLSFITLTAHAQGKLAFINPAVLIDQSPQAKAASKKLETEFGQREAELRARAQNINEMDKSYQTDRAIMSEEQKQKAENEIDQEKRKFQFDQQNLQDSLQTRRKQLLLDLQKEISVVIRKYGDDNGYDFIFTTDAVAYAGKSVDVTAEIVKELNK